MKNSNPLITLAAGVVLFLLGLGLFLANIEVQSLHFYSFGKVSTAPILLVLLLVLIVFAVVKFRWYTIGLVFLDIILIIVSVILGTRFYLHRMSALTLVLLGLISCVGLGLIFRFVLDVMRPKISKK